MSAVLNRYARATCVVLLALLSLSASSWSAPTAQSQGTICDVCSPRGGVLHPELASGYWLYVIDVETYSGVCRWQGEPMLSCQGSASEGCSITFTVSVYNGSVWVEDELELTGMAPCDGNEYIYVLLVPPPMWGDPWVHMSCDKCDATVPYPF